MSISAQVMISWFEFDPHIRLTAVSAESASDRLSPSFTDTYGRLLRARWLRRRTLGSPHPADHLDSPHICLNNPENHQKTSRMDSPEPSIDKRPKEEGRKGREQCVPHGLVGGNQGSGGAARQARQSP